MHPWCRSTTVPHVGNWRDKFYKENTYKYQVEQIERIPKPSGALNDTNDPYQKEK